MKHLLQGRELRRIFPLLLFWAGYTLLFLVWKSTFFFTLPFLLGLLVAAAVQPVIRFFDNKLHWNHTLSTSIVTVLTFLLLSAATVFLCVIAIQEITSFLVRASENGFAEFSQPVSDFFRKMEAYLQKFHLEFWGQSQEQLLERLQNSMEFILGALRVVLEILSSLPTIVILLIVMMVSAFFIARDMDKLKDWLKNLLSSHAASQIKEAMHSSGGMGQKYLFSYLFLYFITFCETYVILNILSVSYPLAISLGTAVADVLPVLGPGFIFVPLTVYHLLIGEYAKVVGLLIGWAIVSLIRQILEPKLISSTIKIHPLAMLAAVYFSLVGKSFWIFLYILGFFTLYSVFRETGALPKFSEIKKDPAEDTSAESNQ